MGKPVAGQSAGEPVASGSVPYLERVDLQQRPQTSDDFNSGAIGPQWEWNHNPDDEHWSLTARPGFMRLIPTSANDLFSARNTLTQCMQDESFQFTARVDLSAMKNGVHAGLAMFEKMAGGLEVVQQNDERRINFFHAQDRTAGPAVSQRVIQLRVRVEGDQARYFFSTDDGRSFQPLGGTTQIQFSWWKGSRPSLFAYTTQSGAPGSIDIDWVRYEPLAGSDLKTAQK
jgi:beta-xylosidase